MRGFLMKIDRYLKERGIRLPIILDVGCGNSMFHPFLEKELNAGIIGIDRIEGTCPHPNRTNIMDICMDSRKFAKTFQGMADIVFWLSSIEHNTKDEMCACLQASLDTLKPGGLFLATICFAPETSYYEPSQCTILSKTDAEEVFGVPWKEEPDFDKTVSEYRLDLMELDTRHFTRYGTREYAFVVAGVEWIKP